MKTTTHAYEPTDELTRVCRVCGMRPDSSAHAQPQSARERRTQTRWRYSRASFEYVLLDDAGHVLAYVSKNGVAGRDDYPWDWWLAFGVQPVHGERATGCNSTMRDAREMVEIVLGLR